MRNFIPETECETPFHFCPPKALGVCAKPPILLASEEDWVRVREWMRSSVRLRKVESQVMELARGLLDREVLPIEPDPDGRKRMLTPARRVMAHVLILGLARHLSGDPIFSKRAAAEVEKAVERPDWNPEVFLNTAELAFGVAIALNWLGDDLSSKTKERWENALINLALKPSLGEAEGRLWWLTIDNNWAQVCHSGLAAAALVCAHRCPELSNFILSRAVQSQAAALAKYGPDGVYPEGPMYWSYGTHYTIMLIDLLERNYGTCFGLDCFPGFMKSAHFVRHATSPDAEHFFSFGDARREVVYFPALHWLSTRYGDAFVDENQFPLLEKLLSDPSIAQTERMQETRFWPLGLLWQARTAPADGPPRLEPATAWLGQGEVPIACLRTAWQEPSAAWTAIKGGSCLVNHSHMDIGHFVYASQGVLWTPDLGMQQYESLEIIGLSINPKGAGSDRWKVFRLGPESHNLLRFDGQNQRPDAECRDLRMENEDTAATATLDLTPAYAEQATRVQRCLRLFPDGMLEIEDSWESNANEVRWQFLTFARARHAENGVNLQHGEKKLGLRFSSDLDFTIVIEEADDLLQSFDEPNPGLQRIIIILDNIDKSAHGLTTQAVPLQEIGKGRHSTRG